MSETDPTEPAANASADDERRQRRRDYLKRWKQANPERVKTYAERYRAAHREQLLSQKRDAEKAREARNRAEEQRRELKRVRARQWYAHNSEKHLDHQRTYRAKKRAEDPVKYRADKRARTRRWHDAHREQENAKLRQKYHDNPEARRSQASKYYAAHAEEVKARRRAYYAANKEKQLAKQREWRQREKRRRDAGLPPRRLHRTPADERRANTVSADQFFARDYTRPEITNMRQHVPVASDHDERTPPELYAAWIRDCARARATHRLATHAEESARLRGDLSHAHPASIARALEDARLDAIGKQVNDRLRGQQRARRTESNDPAAPHTMAQNNPQIGMTR